MTKYLQTFHNIVLLCSDVNEELYNRCCLCMFCVYGLNDAYTLYVCIFLCHTSCLHKLISRQFMFTDNRSLFIIHRSLIVCSYVRSSVRSFVCMFGSEIK